MAVKTILDGRGYISEQELALRTAAQATWIFLVTCVGPFPRSEGVGVWTPATKCRFGLFHLLSRDLCHPSGFGPRPDREVLDIASCVAAALILSGGYRRPVEGRKVPVSQGDAAECLGWEEREGW